MLIDELTRSSSVELSVNNGNGAASSSGIVDYEFNGSVEKYTNGGVNVVDVEGNGRLLKYGNGAAAVAAEGRVTDDGRMKRIEEIGKEDAWFKQTEAQNVIEVLYLIRCILQSSCI